MRPSSRIFLSILPAAASLLPLVAAAGTWPGWSGLKHMIVFGDSFTRIGYVPGSSPAPSSSNPLGVPAPGRPSSNGPNWLAYLTRTYNAQHTVLTHDLAAGGATVSRNLVAGPATAKMLNEQLAEWLPLVKGWTGNETLVAVWIGINDVRLGWQSDVQVESVVGEYFVQLQRMYASGARNFLLLDVPDMTRSPESQALNGSERAALGVYNTAYNSLLSQGAREFEAANDVVVFTFGMGEVADDVLDRYTEFGISNTHEFCAAYENRQYNGNGDWETFVDANCTAAVGKYYWLDKTHPTSTVHREWGRRLAGFLQAKAPQ
ncbi:hypothetical protein BZA05DRAFT_462066 [Tricharina praecox]|uniref:uncharacterized protein n=1 Tax=Tricharina praecox TaxID=43433 RepID=UPI00221F4231|nr:uncharacterized protein BZA05DRAFT_462066 [Tricharina praecox]KAI5842354.1 hypothetical protein BZA05DRAFT_462066 [Tricharina praecox]